MARPRRAPHRLLAPRRPATHDVPRPRGAHDVVPVNPPGFRVPLREGRVVAPVSSGSPSVPFWLAVAYVLAVGLVLAVGFVGLLRPVLSQIEGPTDGPEVTPTIAFDPPVALPADSSYVETVVLPSGDLKVTHWIHSRIPLFGIRLAAPELDGSRSGRVVATRVEVAADGRAVPGADSVDSSNQIYQLFGATSVSVSYVLAGAVERSASAEGRALARVTSLDVSYASLGGTSTRSIEGADVLALACTPAGSLHAVPEPCGSPEHGRWQVELSGNDRDDRVMVQMNMD